MKKLIKSAKQQFTEAIVGYYLQEQYGDSEYYMHEKDGKAVIYCSCESEELYHYKDYGKSWDEMCDDDEFAESIIYQQINGGEEHITDILHWWCEGRDKMNMPFSLGSIFDCDYMEQNYGTFEDIYEDVPDKTIITAEQQWDEESKDLHQFYLGDGTYRIKKDDGVFTLYIAIDGIFEKRLYPSFDELRKDASFVVKYIDYVQKSHPDDMEYALEWLNGGEYTMSEVSLLDIYDIIEPLKSIIFEDKEEYPIEEMLKLTEKQNEAVGMIENGLYMLHKNGGKLITDEETDSWYAVNGLGLEIVSSDRIQEYTSSNGYKDVCKEVGSQLIDFFHDSNWMYGGRIFAKKV